MARIEQNRHDLMSEARGLLPRCKLQLAQSSCEPTAKKMPETVVIGWQPTGGVRVYFGFDEVYQFNSFGQLRRAFLDSDMFVAEAGGLASLIRQRSADRVELIRRTLSQKQLSEFLRQAESRLVWLGAAIQSGDAALQAEEHLAGSKPVTLESVAAWLAGIPRPIVVAEGL